MNLVTAEHLTKSYTERLLFDDTDFSINEGDKIGLIGINGTGKSTLLKLVAGLEEPDSGRIVRGRNLDIRYLPQNPVFHPGETVLESVLRENEGHEHVWDIESQAKSMLNRLGIPDFNEKVEHLSGGQKKRAALASVLLSTAELLILDEPTASLNEDDSQALLELLLKFKKQGMTSIIISHKLNEISYVADKITVIRDGSTIETLDKKKDDFSEQRIIQGMVGREMTDRFPKRPGVKIGDVSMEVKNWNVYHPLYSERKVVDNVSFKVHKGEVVGISGLMGAGRTELAMSIFGKSYGTKISGQVFINGKEVKLNTVQEAIDNKLAYVTEDRKGNGLILSKSIKMNTSLANMKGISNGKVIDADKEYAIAEEYRKKLKTKCPSVEQNVGNLSGGNQQKVLLAKWMFAEPDILILDEPTNHLDMKTKDILKQAIKDFNGTVIVVSHDREFLDGLVDKVYEFGNKRIKEHLGGIYDFLQRKKMETLQDLERNNNVGSKSVSNNSGDKEISETKLSYEERKELQRQIKRLEKAIADNEKRVEQIEAEIQSVEEQLASPEGASDTQLYEKHGALKKALDEVMENWTEHSEQLENLRLQDL